MIALKIVKWKIAGIKKKDFADLVKDVKSVAKVSGFTPCPQFRVGPNGVTQTWPGCHDSFKMATSEVDLSIRIS